MSNAKYIRNRATAERLIRNNGALLALKRETDGGVDPVTEEPTDPVVMNQNAWMVVLPPKTGVSGSEKYESFRGDNGTIDFSVLKDYLLSTQNLQWRPLPLDFVMIKGEWWRLETLQTLDPDGETDIFYKGILRRV